MLRTMARVGSARTRQSLTVICIRQVTRLCYMKAVKKMIVMKNLKKVTTIMMTTILFCRRSKLLLRFLLIALIRTWSSPLRAKR